MCAYNDFKSLKRLQLKIPYKKMSKNDECVITVINTKVLSDCCISI